MRNEYSQLALVGMVLCATSMVLGFVGYAQRGDVEEGLEAFVMVFFIGFLPFGMVYLGIKMKNMPLFYLGAILGIIALPPIAFLFFDDAEYTALLIGGIFECVALLILGVVLAVRIKTSIESRRQKKLVSQKFCPRCGKEVEANWKVCPYCKTDLKPVICPHCRHANPSTSTRCQRCGSLFMDETRIY